MTAEIAILNRSGIAIAADSAITIGNERVWQSSNKIFSLGPQHDLAIMVYGSGAFGGCPWEIVIKEFRLHTAKVAFGNVSECVTNFQSFIKQPRWRDQEEELLSNAHFLVSKIEYLLTDLQFDGSMDFRRKVTEEAARLSDEIKDDRIMLPDLTLAEFSAKFSEMGESFLNELSGRVITKALNNSVLGYLFEAYRRERNASGYETGIVFFGFGQDQIFPAFEEWVYDGRLDDNLRFWPWRSMNLNDERAPAGVIVAFAQGDMVNLFMEGISPNYAQFFFDIIGGILEDKSDQIVQRFPVAEKKVEAAIQKKENEMMVEKIAAAFNTMKQMEVVSPLMGAIRALPKEEMMAMAEAFVELTSMRRKVDSALQTVGGPVDVAFISKGDGFIWGKRKLYFERDLNGDYFERRARRLS